MQAFKLHKAVKLCEIDFEIFLRQNIALYTPYPMFILVPASFSTVRRHRLGPGCGIIKRNFDCRSEKFATGSIKLCAFDDFLCISFSCVWESNLKRRSEWWIPIHTIQAAFIPLHSGAFTGPTLPPSGPVPLVLHTRLLFFYFFFFSRLSVFKGFNLNLGNKFHFVCAPLLRRVPFI